MNRKEENVSNYTPGPWKAIPPDEHCKEWFIGRDRLGAPLGIVPRHLHDGRPYYIAVFGAVFGELMAPDAAEANAHLVEAAPDLLAALEAVEWIDAPDGQARCPWCEAEKPHVCWETNGVGHTIQISVGGHADDCQRQAALKKARGE